MAAINFLYRSKRERSFLNLRLLYTHNNTNYVFGGKTKLEVSKLYWDTLHNKSKFKTSNDVDEQNKISEIKEKQIQVKSELNKIENHILKAFNKEDIEIVDKVWLNNQIELYYNPPKKSKILPLSLLLYFDFYLKERKNELAEQTLKNYKVVKKLLEKFESSINNNIKIIDVNSNFKTSFEVFCIDKGYSTNTIARAIHTVKGVCKHAMYNGIEISSQLERIRIKEVKTEKIYLTFKELEIIEKLSKKDLNESLINARDWLVISCYTGQRVSDFMRFNRKQIRIEKGKPLIEFTQKKTGKNMTVPLHPLVSKILKKRNGEFPRVISSQKYNDYIKQVCQIAKINEKLKGSKLIKTENKESFPYRKQIGEYEKWELVTSHIGRRSFATNFYGTIPTSLLIYATGHKTELMFLNYIGKSNKDLAIELINYF